MMFHPRHGEPWTPKNRLEQKLGRVLEAGQETKYRMHVGAERARTGDGRIEFRFSHPTRRKTEAAIWQKRTPKQQMVNNHQSHDKKANPQNNLISSHTARR